jgi:hypothetical protein
MSDTATLKADLKKFSARAMQAKMDLHDLSEELPINWEKILDLARVAYDAFATLDRKRAELKQAEQS